MRNNLVRSLFHTLCSHLPNSPRTPNHRVHHHPFANSCLQIAEETLNPLNHSGIQAPKACLAPSIFLDDLPADLLAQIAKQLAPSDFYRLGASNKTLANAISPLEPEKRKEAVIPLHHFLAFSEEKKIKKINELASTHVHAQLDQALLQTLPTGALSNVEHLRLGWISSHPGMDQHPEDIFGTFNSAILNNTLGLNNITSLRTSDPTDFEPLDDFSAFSHCQALKKVVFGGSAIKLTHAQLSNLGLAPQLEDLSFTGSNALTTANIGALKTFPNLKSLTLNRCITIFPGILQELKFCPKLTSLTINNANQKQTLADIQHLLQHAPQLQTLHFGKYLISDEHTALLLETAEQRNAGKFNTPQCVLQPVTLHIEQLKLNV